MIIFIILFFVFLIGSFVLQAASSSFRVFEHTQSKEQLRAGKWFAFFRSFQRLFFAKREFEVLLFSISCTRHILRYCLALSITLFLWTTVPPTELKWLWLLIGFLVFMCLSLIFGDFIPRYFATRHPSNSLKFSSPLATLFLIVTSPISFLLLAFSGKKFATSYLEEGGEAMPQVTEKIKEMIDRADVQSTMDQNERELFASVADFCDRIVREVMTPRVDIFALSANLTLFDAAKLFDEEGYSRAPVYKENIDQVIGLAMYKDIMGVTLDDETALNRPLETIVKPIIFIPETSRITNLLQQFREKQTHLAIVVDEYGGTEGLITIEDCLEEIVGEISDEYDEAEQQLYTREKTGIWIVDGRMPILDIEEQFGLKIPQESDYDTIGGYAFHKAGEIPAPGLKIRHDDFELEILESSERCIEKVKITLQTD